ncbi:MAG: DinB family protein [Theionarchaea archaeon]|nr:DinB family protein [Theionarchaea archaeon]
MMNKKETLLEDMQRSIDDLLSVTENLSTDAFESRIITGTWTSREILCHVAAWDCVFCEMSKALLDGAPVSLLPEFDAFNAQEVKKRESLTRDEILREVKKNRALYIRFIGEVPPDQLQDARGQDFTIEGLARDIISHDVYHLHQIRDKLH